MYRKIEFWVLECTASFLGKTCGSSSPTELSYQPNLSAFSPCFGSMGYKRQHTIVEQRRKTTYLRLLLRLQRRVGNHQRHVAARVASAVRLSREQEGLRESNIKVFCVFDVINLLLCEFYA